MLTYLVQGVFMNNVSQFPMPISDWTFRQCNDPVELPCAHILERAHAMDIIATAAQQKEVAECPLDRTPFSANTITTKNYPKAPHQEVQGAMKPRSTESKTLSRAEEAMALFQAKEAREFFQAKQVREPFQETKAKELARAIELSRAENHLKRGEPLSQADKEALMNECFSAFFAEHQPNR